MPPKKHMNAFMQYAKEWQRQSPVYITLEEAVTQCSDSWKNMNPEERSPYVEISKQKKLASKPKSADSERMPQPNNTPTTLNTSYEAESVEDQNPMQQKIRTLVESAIQNEFVVHQKFYFICLSRDDTQQPREISILEFSLYDGIKRELTVFVELENAERPKGQTWAVKSRRQPPLPPTVVVEKELGFVYNKLRGFINPKNMVKDLPPIFTLRSHVSELESVLELMTQYPGVRTRSSIEVCDIELLLHQLKQSLCNDAGKENMPTSQSETDKLFEADKFQLAPNLSCELHQTPDCAAYCASICIKQWAYLFTGQLCANLAIDLKVGSHKPELLPVKGILQAQKSPVAQAYEDFKAADKVFDWDSGDFASGIDINSFVNQHNNSAANSAYRADENQKFSLESYAPLVGPAHAKRATRMPKMPANSRNPLYSDDRKPAANFEKSEGLPYRLAAPQQHYQPKASIYNDKRNYAMASSKPPPPAKTDQRFSNNTRKNSGPSKFSPAFGHYYPERNSHMPSNWRHSPNLGYRNGAGLSQLQSTQQNDYDSAENVEQASQALRNLQLGNSGSQHNQQKTFMNPRHRDMR